MGQTPAVVFTTFAGVWRRATETEIGAALCAVGAGRVLTFFMFVLCYFIYFLCCISSCLSLYHHILELKMV